MFGGPDLLEQKLFSNIFLFLINLVGLKKHHKFIFGMRVVILVIYPKIIHCNITGLCTAFFQTISVWLKLADLIFQNMKIHISEYFWNVFSFTPPFHLPGKLCILIANWKTSASSSYVCIRIVICFLIIKVRANNYV